MLVTLHLHKPWLSSFEWSQLDFLKCITLWGGLIMLKPFWSFLTFIRLKNVSEVMLCLDWLTVYLGILQRYLVWPCKIGNFWLFPTKFGKDISLNLKKIQSELNKTFVLVWPTLMLSNMIDIQIWSLLFCCLEVDSSLILLHILCHMLPNLWKTY